MDFQPDRPAGRFLLETIARGSSVKLFYDNYRFTVLSCLRPDIYADIRQSVEEDYPQTPPIGSVRELRRYLTDNLLLLVHIGAKELGISNDQELSKEQLDMLTVFFEAIGEASKANSSDLIEAEPALGQLQNPLMDPEMIQQLWSWRQRNKRQLPDLSKLIRFEIT